jgi:hypothetical protein
VELGPFAGFFVSASTFHLRLQRSLVNLDSSLNAVAK